VGERKDWQGRPLDACYPVVFFDALRVKIRDEGLVKNKAVYVALALDADGHKHVLGPWIEQTEGAKFWLKVMNDLKTRGVGDILIAVVDGLKGFPEAIGAVFPETPVQTCIVHLIRSSMAFVSWKDRKQIMPDLKAIYRAENAEAAWDRLGEFEAHWGAKYPAVGQSWRRAWDHVVPLFGFPPDIRKMIYTTNAVESLNQSLRKIIKTRGSFPNDEAAMKLLYLAIQNAGVGAGPLSGPPPWASLPSCSATALRSQRAESAINDPQRRLHRLSDTLSAASTCWTSSRPSSSWSSGRVSARRPNR
jgi:putative transposase